MKSGITTKKPEENKICLSCFEPIKRDPIRELIENDIFLCEKCISHVRTKLEIDRIGNTFVLFLGKYDGIMKTWLMNYKEYGDMELAKAFLYLYLPILKIFFPNHIYVPCPSHHKRNEERGFIHLEEMLKAYSLPYCLALEKTSAKENKEQTVSGRNSVSESIVLNKEADSLSGKKVVVFDDVLTTGNTFLSSCREIAKVSPKRIHGLILMRTKKPESRL